MVTFPLCWPRSRTIHVKEILALMSQFSMRFPRGDVMTRRHFHIDGPCMGESTGDRWNPRTKGQWCGVWWFLSSILDVNISFSVACLYPPFTSQSWTGFVSLSIVLIIPILKCCFQFEHAHHDVHLFDFVLFYGVVLSTLARFTEISTRIHPCFVTGMGTMLCDWSNPKWYWLL